MRVRVLACSRACVQACLLNSVFICMRACVQSYSCKDVLGVSLLACTRAIVQTRLSGCVLACKRACLSEDVLLFLRAGMRAGTRDCVPSGSRGIVFPC
jgi:hypothetical protein